jgi:hypothetical protein
MFDIIAETLIFTILNIIGGTIRWLFATIFNFIFNTSKHPYRTYVSSADTNELFDDAGRGCVNIIIGIIFIVLLAMLIYSI